MFLLSQGFMPACQSIPGSEEANCGEPCDVVSAMGSGYLAEKSHELQLNALGPFKWHKKGGWISALQGHRKRILPVNHWYRGYS